LGPMMPIFFMRWKRCLRMTDLVKQEAVANRLMDEAQKKFEAAEAEKAAAIAAVTSATAELSLSRSQATAAEADLEVAKASTEVARRELDELDELIKYSKLVSPFDGVVAERHVNPGDLIRNTQTGSSREGPPMFIVKQLNRVRVRVAVPERDAPLVDVGDTAEISLQALPGPVLKGTVSRFSRMLDEHTRTMLVEIDLPNPNGKLLPGMFGQATITLVPPRETLLLPAAAVRYDEVGNTPYRKFKSTDYEGGPEKLKELKTTSQQESLPTPTIALRCPTTGGHSG